MKNFLLELQKVGYATKWGGAVPTRGVLNIRELTDDYSGGDLLCKYVTSKFGDDEKEY